MSLLQNANYEKQRIAELRKYNILDSLSEKDYEDITFLASAICDVPIALISFVDENRQWFKSHRGISASETPREHSFCAHALNNPKELMIVEDSRLDDRFKDNPLVTGDPHIVFYAGFPLVNTEGFGLGTVCIIDRKVRVLTAVQVKALQVLSAQVVHLLELRKANYDLEATRFQLDMRNKGLEQFAMVVSHDIKSPLSTVLSANQLLTTIYNDRLDENANKLIEASSSSANKIRSLADGILSYYKGNSNPESYEEIDLHQFFEALKHILSSSRPYSLTYQLAGNSMYFNKAHLEQIFYNLINNSIRYNNNETADIHIDYKEENDSYHFSVTDNGTGIAPESYDTIFNLFTKAAANQDFNLKGLGIGLPTVKKIIKTAGGNITVNSEPGKGSVFNFTLKKRPLKS